MAHPDQLYLRLQAVLKKSLGAEYAHFDLGASPSSVGSKLANLVQEGRTAWPSAQVTDEEFVDYLAARIAATDKRHGDLLSGIHGSDLYLACACASLQPGAIAAFEKNFLHLVPSYVGHLNNSAEFTDEVRQILRERLFVAEKGETPKIGDYSGRGPLGSWVRVSALRTALSLKRSEQAQRTEPEEDVDASLPLKRDPEMDFIKERYKVEFKTAFQQAFSALTAEQRNVLRLHYLDGLNIERIGAMFRVHRSTVARWISASCAQVLDETRRLLRARLNLSPAEFDSLADVVKSQIDLSIVRYLRESPP